MTWFTYELSLSNFSISFWQCICNSRNVEGCNFVLKILHNGTMVIYFYGNMCTYNTYFFESLVCLLLPIVFFLIRVSSSPHGWHHFCPAISRMNCKFHQICLCYVWTYICIFVIFLLLSYLFICDFLLWPISFVPFLEYFLHRFWVNDLDDIYTDISFIIV